MTDMARILKMAEERHARTVEWRRHLHQYPEVSYREVRTSAFIMDKLTSWGIPAVRPDGMQGVVATIAGDRSGKTIALRADIDALPIQDEKQSVYASKSPGVMHACGHDGHAAVLLAVASILQELRAEVAGKVILVFQHAEEVTPGGAKAILESGLLEGVEEIYGIHLWSPLSTGTVASIPGPMMAAPDEFKIDITGKGGHAALPHTTSDSLVAAGHLIVNLQTIVSRSIDPIEPCVVTVGAVHGGSAFNVIAERCTLIGTVRSFDEQVRRLALAKVRQLASQTCEMFGATAEVEIRRGYPALINHERETAKALALAAELPSVTKAERLQPVMAGEDFAYYLRAIPGCFLFVGCGNADKGAVYPHHHPKFDIDEDALLVAAQLFLRLVFSEVA